MFDFDVVTGPTQPPQLPAELSANLSEAAAALPAPPAPDVQAKEPAPPQ